MGKIILEDIRIYGYHGHLPEEQKTGNKFLVNLEMDTAFEQACKSDALEDTFDYSLAFSIVNEEMKKPSKLLEHVANRIMDRIFEASELVWAVKLKVSKLNPPFGGDVCAVAVELYKEREVE